MPKIICEKPQKKGIVLFVVVAMSFLATLDSSIVNIALPVMSKSLAVPLSSIEWVIASYVMIICSTLLFFGRLGDVIGKTKVFSFGSFLFVIGSLMCGLCNSFVPLIICRFIQGIGASCYMANNQGIITQLYPDRGRGKALGILAAAVALGSMIGAPLGGLIVSKLSWNFVFYVTTFFGSIIFILGAKFLPNDKAAGCQHFDNVGSLLQFFGTMILFGALIEAQKLGFANSFIITAIIVALIFIGLFIVYEKKNEEPLLDISLFENHLFSISLICALISFVCISAYILLLPFYLQNTLKLMPSQSGLIMMISPLIIAILAGFCGNLADKIGAEVLTLVGLVVMASSFLLMSLLNVNSPIFICVICLAIMAVGQSLFQPANNSLIMSALPKNKLGIGGSVNSLVRNLGQYVGIVLSTTLLYCFMSQKIGYRVIDYIKGRDDVFVFGMKYVFLILMALCFIGAVFTAYRLIKAKKN